VIRSVPQREPSGGASTHMFDLYGRSASSASRSHPCRSGAGSGLAGDTRASDAHLYPDLLAQSAD
jgi:hypothetical protein